MSVYVYIRVFMHMMQIFISLYLFGVPLKNTANYIYVLFCLLE